MAAEGVSNEEVLRALRRLVQRSLERSRVLAKRTGLTLPQLLCLRAVAELPPERCTVAHVADHADLAMPTASRVLTQLVNADLLRREHTPSDRRKVFLTLTETGNSRLVATIGAVHPQFIERFEKLPPAEQEQLLATLNKIVEMMSV
jgi:DNA-binding MarR family transcriptional regulator